MAPITQTELKAKLYMFTLLVILIGGLCVVLSKVIIPDGNSKVIILIIGNIIPILGNISGSISKAFKSV